MTTLFDFLKNTFSEAVHKVFPDLAIDEYLLELTPSTQEKYGHFQFNSSMKIAKIMGKNPRQIAQLISEQIVGKEEFEKIEIAGPGFINVTFSSEFIAKCVNEMLKRPHLAIAYPKHPQKIIVEFSSPNIAKEMHVGHLRSTIIGDCIARLFEYLGHNVLRLNHIGDWGTAFGMLIAYMKKLEPNVLKGKEKTDLPTLMHWYKESKKLFDQDEEFKAQSRLEVVKLQGGDEQSLKAWELICEISRSAYQEIYDLLDVKIIERGESFYNPELAKVVEDLEEKGLITISEGAKCIYLEGFQSREGTLLPLMVQKSDGGYNYDTTDMAAMRHRVAVDQAERIIIVTDAGQSTHFQMIYRASVKANYLDPAKVRFDHVPFGLVLGPDGKKFRTRSGDTEKLIDLLTTAIDKAKKILEEREPNIPDEKKKEIAKILGVSAIKYADLCCNRVGDYIFSYDRMLKFEGNTATFLMYSYVRIAGIKKRIQGLNIEELVLNEKIEIKHPSEVDLALHIAQFEETLKLIEQDLLPNHLTEYLYVLAQKFNAFFRDCRVEGSVEQNSRLLLCELVRQVMDAGFHILGIQTVEKM